MHGIHLSCVAKTAVLPEQLWSSLALPLAPGSDHDADLDLRLCPGAWQNKEQETFFPLSKDPEKKCSSYIRHLSKLKQRNQKSAVSFVLHVSSRWHLCYSAQRIHRLSLHIIEKILHFACRWSGRTTRLANAVAMLQCQVGNNIKSWIKAMVCLSGACNFIFHPSFKSIQWTFVKNKTFNYRVECKASASITWASTLSTHSAAAIANLYPKLPNILQEAATCNTSAVHQNWVGGKGNLYCALLWKHVRMCIPQFLCAIAIPCREQQECHPTCSASPRVYRDKGLTGQMLSACFHSAFHAFHTRSLTANHPT